VFSIHNTYVLAAAWRLANDMILELAKKGVTDGENLKSKAAANPETHQLVVDLFEVLNYIARLQLDAVRTFATSSGESLSLSAILCPDHS
jgi:hypothetical protein